ncbi:MULTISPECIES: IclR family transcriptional regulator [Nocardia]|uniref:IclR family transcriptional regulator n=1 Tax=Nocardia TaxID=1817 RepID=UPI001895D0A5|nr:MULTISPECIES: IclR family transcriptional regulator [Nocardia]MBF6348239.1 IclR family transcriptional regulator [Nocardia flavorosea]
MSAEPNPSVVGRAVSLLRAVAAEGEQGVTTSELARRAGLARPTAHRLLVALADEGFLDRDAGSGRWLLGPELFLMGSLAAERYDITHAARPVLRELARETGESAFLSARRGDETVCLTSEEGSFPLRSHVLYPGIRFPLGVASAGLVILAHLPDRDIEDYLAHIDLSGDWGAAHARGELTRRVAATRESGWCVNPGLLVEGSWGMAAAVFDRRDEPQWALSLTGVESRFRADRRPELGRLLLRHAHNLSRELRRRPAGRIR